MSRTVTVACPSLTISHHLTPSHSAQCDIARQSIYMHWKLKYLSVEHFSGALASDTNVRTIASAMMKIAKVLYSAFMSSIER